MTLARLLAPAAQQRRILAIAAAIVGCGLALAPFAHRPLPAAPAFTTFFTTLLAGADILTFLLLANGHFARRSRTVTLLGCGYLLNGLFALVHVATFPGALAPGVAIAGGPDAAGWLFMAWRFAFPVVALAAVASYRPHVVLPDDEIGPRAYALCVTGTVVAVFGTALVLFNVPLPAYFVDGRFAGWAVVAAWFAAGISAFTAAWIWRRPDTRQVLLLYLSVVLLAEAIGHALSNIAGVRYTVGWYALRVFDLAAASIVLSLLLSEAFRTQRALKDAVTALESRTQSLHAEVQRREAAERQLVRAQRMDAIGQLAGGIGHDFNNVLHVIAMRAELAMRRQPGEDVLADVGIIRRSVERGQALTRQLLSLSGRRALQPRLVDVRAWLPGFLDVLRSVAVQGIELRTEIAPHAGPVHVDPVELEIALVNLVTNARDAMTGGGAITVVVRNEATAAGEQVLFAVRDEGEGIDPAIVDRVFEPFFTTKDAGRGSGLGLSQVNAFVERSGGMVTLESTRFVGTTVWMRFPRAIAKAAAAAGDAPSSVPSREAVHTVLVVDDNEDIADATVRLLENLGFVAHRAHSADDAADLLERRRVAPHVVLSDIVMPGEMDGVDLARYVRAHFPGVAVVLSTGYSASVGAALTDGFTVLAKPYEADALLQALAGAIAGPGGPSAGAALAG